MSAVLIVFGALLVVYGIVLRCTRERPPAGALPFWDDGR